MEEGVLTIVQLSDCLLTIVKLSDCLLTIVKLSDCLLIIVKLSEGVLKIVQLSESVVTIVKLSEVFFQNRTSSLRVYYQLSSYPKVTHNCSVMYFNFPVILRFTDKSPVIKGLHTAVHLSEGLLTNVHCPVIPRVYSQLSILSGSY